MYRAKDQGRARTELFDETAHQLAVTHLQTDADLHRALERSEFRVHYQPIVDLETGLVCGFEALARWQHPTRGLLNPEEFISLAEDAGLIVPIGAWILEEACRQTKLWQERQRGDQDLGISVNVSPRQLGDPSLPEELERILHVTGIDPRMVWLELTEGALMQDADESIRALEGLTAQGVRLAVDDFGTGYSSLAHLKRFPVELLKVDQTFVDGLGREPEDTSIVGAVVSLAHSLGLSAIAEGLETPLQLAELRTMGCDYAQGYLFGAPKAADAIGDHPADDLSAWHDAPTR
jgi:EAL domain-containing protein (putative c-di-GMP-specific phosphodiesterase class I)